MKPNLTYINSLSGDDIVFKEKLICIFKEEFPLEKEKYRFNLSAKDYDKAADDVHKLKHKISILGMDESYRIAEQFENNLREKTTILKDDFKNILDVISEYIQNI